MMVTISMCYIAYIAYNIYYMSIYCFCPFSCFNVLVTLVKIVSIFSKAVLFQRKSSLKFVPHVSIWMCCVNSFGFSLVSLQLEIQTGLSCYTMLRHDLIHQKLMFLALEGMSKWYALDKRQALPWSGGSWTASRGGKGLETQLADEWLGRKVTGAARSAEFEMLRENLENMKVAHEIRLRYNQHLNQQTPTKNHSPLFFWCSSYMKIRISSRWMLLLLHQLTWSQVIQAFAGAQSGWGRMHFLGHADGNPYASASVPWQ